MCERCFLFVALADGVAWRPVEEIPTFRAGWRRAWRHSCCPLTAAALLGKGKYFRSLLPSCFVIRAGRVEIVRKTWTLHGGRLRGQCRVRSSKQVGLSISTASPELELDRIKSLLIAYFNVLLSCPQTCLTSLS